MGKHWDDCDDETRAFVKEAVAILRSHLGTDLRSVLLHGSLAHGCYFIPKSDIDILAVIASPLSESTAKDLLQAINLLNDRRPHTGSLELSLVLEESARTPAHLIPYEVHFGEEYADAIRSGLYDYTARRGRDPDLAAHFSVARKIGICLYGTAALQILGPVPWPHFLDAIDAGDLDWILTKGNILTSPFYGVLNACRVVMTRTCGEGTVVSKEDGALWALENFPAEHREIIRQALDVYRASTPVTPEKRRTGGVEWDREKLLAFRDFIAAKGDAGCDVSPSPVARLQS
jgi:streptomycin 3"-adenylyltransferase